jgi:hypothetical protein
MSHCNANLYESTNKVGMDDAMTLVIGWLFPGNFDLICSFISPDVLSKMSYKVLPANIDDAFSPFPLFSSPVAEFLIRNGSPGNEF